MRRKSSICGATAERGRGLGRGTLHALGLESSALFITATVRHLQKPGAPRSWNCLLSHPHLLGGVGGAPK